MLGQNFTELPTIAVYNENSTLFFYKSPGLRDNPYNSNSLKFTLLNHIQISWNKCKLVEVSALDSCYSGNGYEEGYNSNKHCKEYTLHQGIYYSKSAGKCHLVRVPVPHNVHEVRQFLGLEG